MRLQNKCLPLVKAPARHPRDTPSFCSEKNPIGALLPRSCSHPLKLTKHKWTLSTLRTRTVSSRLISHTWQMLNAYWPSDKDPCACWFHSADIPLSQTYYPPLAEISDHLIFYLVQCLMYCWHSINNDQQFGISV